jgi:hypothetical protein
MLDVNTGKLLQTENDDRPDLSSERAPYREKAETFRQKPSDRK